MEEWLSYRLSDLLLFSEQTYARQFERYNRWLFPFQTLAYLPGLLFLPAWLLKHAGLVRALLWLAALAWLLCLYAFMLRLYAPINWIVYYLLPLLLLQAIGLAWAGTRRTVVDRTGLSLILWVSALLLPAVELASGRPAATLSAYALTPDSLAICSIALVLLAGRSAWLCFPALAWLLFSALTYIAMDNPTSGYLLGVLGLSVFSLLRPRAPGARAGS